MGNELEVVSMNVPLTAADIRAQVNLIQEVMRDVMQGPDRDAQGREIPGVHYGLVPGCGDKPTLLQPGAHKLLMTFKLVPDPDMQVIPMERGHREVRCKVKIYSRGGVFLGSGVGTCSTMEGKYRFRKAEQKCPECGRDTIIKGKKEYGGGWLCFQKKGGCGAKFADGDETIENQNMGRVEHDNPADYYNTVEKMAYKRALVSATLTVTAASDIFTQDIEDMPEVIPQSAHSRQASAPLSNSEPLPDKAKLQEAQDKLKQQTQPTEKPKETKPQEELTMAQARLILSDTVLAAEIGTVVNWSLHAELTPAERKEIMDLKEQAVERMRGKGKKGK